MTNASTVTVTTAVCAAKCRWATGISAPVAATAATGHHAPGRTGASAPTSSTPATVPANRLTTRENSGPRSGLTRNAAVTGSQYQCPARSPSASAALAATHTPTRSP